MADLLKKNFIAGLLVILPLGLTYLLFAFLINKLDNLVAPLVRTIIIKTNAPLPEDFHLPGLGFMITCILMVALGVFTKNFFGRKIVASGQHLLESIPFVRSLYTTIRQVIDTVSQVESNVFERMVIVRYPHLSSYVMGLVSCDSKGEVLEKAKDGAVNVFVPMLPNVTLGWMLVVPRDQVTLLKMDREAGIKFLLSFGIVEKAGDEKEGAEPAGDPGENSVKT